MFLYVSVYKTNISHISGAYNSSKRSYNAKPLAYCFYVETKVSVELRICIKLCQKNILTEKKYERLRGRAKMPLRSLALTAGPIILNVRVQKTSKKAILQANTHIRVLF